VNIKWPGTFSNTRAAEKILIFIATDLGIEIVSI
jgi:hypothetical protein